jgi:hypothetical protein
MVTPSARPRGNDRDLVQRIGPWDVQGDESVARFVVGRELLLFVGHRHRTALGAHQHLVLGVFEVGHGDEALADAGRTQRRLVDEVGEIGAGEAGRAARQHARDRRRVPAAPCACGP